MGFRNKNSRGKFLLCSDSNSDDDFNRSKKSKGASSDSKPAAAAAAVVSAASNSRDSEGDDSKFDDLFGGKFDIMLFLDRGFFFSELNLIGEKSARKSLIFERYHRV